MSQKSKDTIVFQKHKGKQHFCLPQQVLSERGYLLGYVQNMISILDEGQVFQMGRLSCSISKTRIVSEMFCKNQIFSNSCGAKVTNSECCNNNWEHCL